MAGSSIIETVVFVALIFLTVFMLSLDVVTSLTIRSDSDVDLISADVEIENLIRTFDFFPLENRTLKYPWGDMEISIQDYDVYHTLFPATVKCRIESRGQS